MGWARAALDRWGIDRPVAYSLAGRGWSLAAGAVTVALIARYMRPEEQGFYYTFWSVIGLYVFCELGLDFVITQFASHEMAQLCWADGGTVCGPSEAKGRLAALLRRSVRWYGAVATLFVGLLIPAGLYFFSQHSFAQHSLPQDGTGAPLSAAEVHWRLPWIVLAGFTMLNLGVSPLFALLEGCGRIGETALVRTGQNALGNAAVWLVLSRGGGLLAVAAFQAAYFLGGGFWLARRYGGFFRDLLMVEAREARLDWRGEVWPFQWRIGVSWISNYLLFQFFNPLLLATHGASEAGRMGMSLSVCTSLLNAAMTWMTTKAAPFGVLVAQRNWRALDREFFRSFRQSTAILAGASAVVGVAVAVVHAYWPRLGGRILEPRAFGTLLLATLLSHAVFCQAQYLRAHKQEPFFGLSMGAGLLSVLVAALVVRPYGAGGMAAGYLLSSALSLAAGTNIFLRKRRVWHA